eukprot:TRINITY_DN3091_c0_g1_i1.p1 TRINITY_DN3091_c0_g1~~TRINITY_DN3091_c0_g1_i1.p1  ORF type:complete len:343 (-),score=69.75 TRINITY_DN3091_c0_g1_i1:26-1054(-)
MSKVIVLSAYIVSLFVGAAWADEECLLQRKIERSFSVQDWFQRQGVSTGVASRRNKHGILGDGLAGDVRWKYYLNTCLQQRQDMVAAWMLKNKCENIVEVGGYASPVNTHVQRQLANLSLELRERRAPKSYINIDPSALAAKDVTEAGTRTVELPMTVADFQSDTASELRKHLDAQLRHPDGYCVAMLGAWSPHVYSRKDKLALRQLFRNAKILAVSSPSNALGVLNKVRTIAQRSNGLTAEASQKVDCSNALKDESTHFPGDETEHLLFLSKASERDDFEGEDITETEDEGGRAPCAGKGKGLLQKGSERHDFEGEDVTETEDEDERAPCAGKGKGLLQRE